MANEKRLDLIDRQALGIGRCNPDAFPLQNRAYVAGWNGVIDILEQAPRVEAVEVVHGRWVFNRGAAPNEKSYFCSVCAEGESDYGTDNYCPNCGAKMDGDGNGEA